MSRLYPSPRRKFTEDKYRIIEWRAEQEKRKEQKKPEETKLTKKEFLKRWNEEHKNERSY